MKRAIARKPLRPIAKPSRPTLRTSEALRLRAKDYQAAGNLPGAQADLDKAVEAAPANGEVYFARGQFFAANKQPERALQDFTLAINLNLERTEVYTARGKAYSELHQYDKADRGLRPGHQAAAGQLAALPGPRHRARRITAVPRRRGGFRSVHRAQAGQRRVLRGARAGLQRSRRLHPRPGRSLAGARS